MLNLPVPFPRSYWIIPGLFLAGEYPGAKEHIEAQQKLGSLREAGISKIINLMEPNEADHTGNLFNSYKKIINDKAKSWGKRISCDRFPIKDLNIPNTKHMRQILDTIDEAIDQRKPVYIHCWGGIQNSGEFRGQEFRVE
ncbi:MAG: hypothetical protein PF482_21470 [Desulfobacteraceae bacterium]|jgi:protein-tyrosine phosphatase|nr:hypothetical protein [Desulfobacteraceae bacterium]